MWLEGPPEQTNAPRSLRARLAWFAALAAGSGLAAALAAGLLSLVLPR